jgi:lipoate-protein ligase A
LEVIDDPQPRPASFNMAADESLLEQIGDAVVLRIYRWLRPAISFGYFTELAAVRQRHEERELVRRWTGGGIVEHGTDFTYSLVIPRRDLVELGSAGRSYELIHQALAEALAGGGAVSITKEHAGAPRSESGAHCFEHPVAHDLLIDGRTTAGAAQRRTRRGLLHQGSVQGVGGVMAAWQERLAERLPETLCSSAVRRGFTPAEEEGAARLAAEKYATQAWLERF